MALSCQKVNLRVFWHKQTSRSKQVRAIGDFVPPIDRRCLSQHIKFEIQIFIYWDRGKSLKYDMVKFSNYVHSLELHTKPLVNI